MTRRNAFSSWASGRFHIELLEDRRLLTFTAEMFADLNALPATVRHSTPDNFVSLGNTAFFSATSDVAGRELWRTDGTEAGTRMVKDIALGPNDSDPQDLVEVDGRIFFSANDGSSGRQLWRSDGTAAGTVLVKDIDGLYVPGPSSADPSSPNRGSEPTELTNVGGILFFAASNSDGDVELWKSDGTEVGTVQVTNINQQVDPDPPYLSFSSNPRGLTNVNGTLFFSADDGLTGRELWKSNGTAATTEQVLDINPGSGGSMSASDSLTNVNGTAFFRANSELWRTDGTLTVHVGSAMSPSSITNVDGTVFFTASDGLNFYGRELWTSDGTDVGTSMVKDINATSGSSLSSAADTLARFGNGVLFKANDGLSGSELWISDGTSNGTSLLKDVRAGNNDSQITFLGNLDAQTHLFTANDGAHGFELWRTDGTTDGTYLVRDIRPGTGSGADGFGGGAIVNGRLVFHGATEELGNEPWYSDGRHATTKNLANVNADARSSAPHDFVEVDGRLFFVAKDSSGDEQIWGTDGSSGPFRLDYDNFDATMHGLTNLNGSLAFATNDTSSRHDDQDGLWVTEVGQYLNSYQTQQLGVSSGLYEVSGLTNVGGTLFFASGSGVSSQNGIELWKSDGQVTGTTIVLDINVGTYNGVDPLSSAPDGLAGGNGLLFFAAGNSTRTIWKSNGSLGNGESIGGKSPRHLQTIGNQVFFSGIDALGNRELWVSDGDLASTRQVKDIFPGDTGSRPYALTNVNGTLYFRANDGANGYELWKSNGTDSGTVMVADINPHGSSSPSHLTNVDGTLYFAADDGANGYELWKSDGTAGSTIKVAEINPTGSAGLSWLTNVDGELFFSATDGVNGYELWRSDGTDSGTVMAVDVNGDLQSSSHPTGITPFNGQLFMAATDATYGTEPWKVTPPLELIVDNVRDEQDGNYFGGDLSLREAIVAANNNPGVGLISFDPAVFGSPTTIDLTLGQIEITGSAQIEGPGQDLLTIDAQQNSRIFDIVYDAGNVSISRMTLTGGMANGGEPGGAIRSTGSGRLTLERSTVTGNTADGGGGGVYSYGAVALLETNLSGNSAGEYGGGLYVASSVTTISSSVISGNNAGYGGGGVISLYSLAVSDSVISDNTAGYRGGGIYASYMLTIASSVVSGNSSGDGGGGIRSDVLHITKSTVSSNIAVCPDGCFGGGISGDEVRIADTTVSDNVASGSYSYGGGIFGVSVVVTNSTISGNTALGTVSRGGGIYSYAQTSVSSSTVSRNSASQYGGGIAASYFSVVYSTVTANAALYGGGIHSDFGSCYVENTVLGSIVAGNSPGADLYLSPTSCSNANFSLIGDNLGSLLDEAPIGMPDAQGNLIGGPMNGLIDAHLGPLQDNGGVTETHALLSGSPAIDSGNPAALAGAPGVPPWDQRGVGFARVAAARIDIGSLELQPAPTCTVTGDLDCSGQVGASDLDLVLNNWGVDSSITGVPAGWVHDLPVGVIGADELDNVLNNWGNTTVLGAPKMPVAALANQGGTDTEREDDSDRKQENLLDALFAAMG